VHAERAGGVSATSTTSASSVHDGTVFVLTVANGQLMAPARPPSSGQQSLQASRASPPGKFL